MRKIFSVILKVIAGFLFYAVSLVAFTSEPPTDVKLGILIGFLVPAVATLGGGLALTRFRHWKRDAGIVLLGASGFTAFIIFTFAFLLMTEEFRRMARPDTLMFFSDYVTGGGAIVGFAVLGWILMKADKEKAKQDVALDEDSAVCNRR